MSPDPAKTPSLLRRALFGRVTLLRSAVLLAAAFGVIHLLGWRGDTAVLSGTFADHNARLAAVRGVLYAMFYFAAVVVSPILILAAGLNVGMSRISGRKSAGRDVRKMPY